MDDLVKYRLESAQERLESAKILLDAGNCPGFSKTEKPFLFLRFSEN